MWKLPWKNCVDRLALEWSKILCRPGTIGIPRSSGAIESNYRRPNDRFSLPDVSNSVLRCRILVLQKEVLVSRKMGVEANP